MKTKTKVLLSVGVVCLVAIVAVVAVVAVFAASEQTITSSINIKYIATEVSATAEANWYVGAETDAQKHQMTTDGKEAGDSNTKVTFVAGQAQGGASTLKPQSEIKDIKTANPYVIFEYKIENTGSQKLKASLSYDNELSNIDAYVYHNPTALTQEDRAAWKSEGPTLKGTKETTKNLFTEEEVEHGATEYFYVIFYIPNVGTNASFAGNFTWTLEAVGSDAAA